MHTFTAWFATSPIASALRVFAATVVALALAAWVESGTITVSNWETWVIAALASSVPVILRALNPSDGVYGVNSKNEYEPFDVFGDEEL